MKSFAIVLVYFLFGGSLQAFAGYCQGGAGQSELYAAIEAHDLPRVRSAILGFGVVLNFRPSTCEPPLFAAVRENQPSITQELIQAGANPNAWMQSSTRLSSSVEDFTVLMWAAEKSPLSDHSRFRGTL